MKIPFTKAHGAKNDFLLTWTADAPATGHSAIARAICDRHTGIGADGWMLVERAQGTGHHGSIRLYNSDGSLAEISGNGTRCAAAFLLRSGLSTDTVRIKTGAGVKELRVLAADGLAYSFDMNMGRPDILSEAFDLDAAGHKWNAVLLWVGNPQCAVPVENFDFDWRAAGAALEVHPHFPNRTNVSFLRKVDAHTIEVRIWERGAGETLSSGTGSTGAAAAAVLRGMVQSPVRVLTPAGPLELCWKGDIWLTGPAEIVADGIFLMRE